jgi:hypothetical protein
LHVTFFIGGSGFLKQQGKIGTKVGWQGGAHLKQGVDEPCNNVVSCKTMTTPPFKPTKIVNEKEQHGGAHPKP